MTSSGDLARDTQLPDTSRVLHVPHVSLSYEL